MNSHLSEMMPLPGAYETSIVTLVPQTAGFLTPGNQAKKLTDGRTFYALKIRLDPKNPASVIGVVIRFTP